MQVKLPWFAEGLFKPYRYKVLYGGRGSAKSHTIARRLLMRGIDETRKVLCAREFQNSIAESVHSLLVEIINEMGLDHHYVITNNKIFGRNGTEFIFKGVKLNVHSIKSMNGVTDLWLEEAHTISQESWDVLIPTIRADDSEIYVSFNPENEDDPTYTMFVNPDGTPKQIPGYYIQRVSWRDNPFFNNIMRAEKDHLFRVNPDLAMHVWEGECRKNSESQIFRNKWVFEPFEIEPYFDGPYFGVDWGFSQDPLAITESYIDGVENYLYVRREYYKTGVELRHMAAAFDHFPKIRSHISRADSSRPETISHVASLGFNIRAAKKWKGSVEDGIDWLKNFDRIVIHTDCPNVRNEAKNYSYKVDRLTKDVLRDIVDANNHAFDSLRYAYEPLIMASKIGGFASC